VVLVGRGLILEFYRVGQHQARFLEVPKMGPCPCTVSAFHLAIIKRLTRNPARILSDLQEAP
jgi:hypothetical protein